MATDAPALPAGLTKGKRPPGLIADRGFRILALAAGLMVLVILALIAIYTTREAWPWFSAEGLGIFSDNWDPAHQHFGAGGLIYGTLLVAGVAVLLSLPISVGIALFVTDVAPQRIRRPIVYTVDLLAAIPSVVYGLWALFVLAEPLANLFQTVSDATASIPILNTLFANPSASGKSFMTAGIIVAIMITPIITSITREVFATVPPAQKEAALALGATRWEMIRGAVFPHSRSGMVAGTMIGLGRAMGETIAIALVVGSSARITANILGPGDTLASIIANQFGEASGTHRAALIGCGVVLFAITILIERGSAGGRLADGPAVGRHPMSAPATRLTQSTRKGRRELKNAVATALIVASFVVALIPLTFIVVYVIRAGMTVFGLNFLTEDLPFSNRFEGGGMYPAIVGTLVITGTATAMAVPLGILGGIYLNEYGGRGIFARLVRFLADVMTGVPSIVMGLFIYTIWVLPRKQAGLSGFAGALALGCLMLPIVIRTTEEILKLVPDELREGSYALGTRKAQTIRRVVFPNAAPGIISGALLGVARVAGETAPLLFTIGIVSAANWNVFDGPNTALPQQIYINASVFGGFDAAQNRAWGAALALILIVFLFTLVARVITAIYTRRSAAV